MARASLEQGHTYDQHVYGGFNGGVGSMTDEGEYGGHEHRPLHGNRGWAGSNG